MIQALAILLLSVFLFLLFLGWIFSAISDFMADRRKLDECISELAKLGLSTESLPELLARVPKGYVPDKRLYFASKKARELPADSPSGEKAEAILHLYKALDWAKQREEVERKDRKAKELERERIRDLTTKAGAPSYSDLIIEHQDFERENRVDRRYRKTIYLRLLKIGSSWNLGEKTIAFS